MTKPTPLSVIREAQWAEVKMIRQRLLTETDYTQMPDYPLSDEKKKEIALYRQLLRDIPKTYTDPTTIVWPQKPKGEEPAQA